ncbi:unnamed protein product, partial [Candidula unifasciata]
MAAVKTDPDDEIKQENGHPAQVGVEEDTAEQIDLGDEVKKKKKKHKKKKNSANTTSNGIDGDEVNGVELSGEKNDASTEIIV